MTNFCRVAPFSAPCYAFVIMTKTRFAFNSPHWHFLCVIFLVVALNVFVRLSFLPLTVSTDSYSYIDSARLMSGEEVAPYPGRLLKPLAPFGIMLFATLFNGDMVAGFLALNVFSYFLLAVATYIFLLFFTPDRILAMLGTLIFTSTYPVLEYGLNLYSEMGAWLFFVVALIGAVRYYRDASWKNFFIALSAISVGLLWKEYSILSGIFFAFILLFEQTRTRKEKFLRLVTLCATSALAVGVVALAVYLKYHFTYFDWLREAASVGPTQSQHTFYYMIKSLFGVYLLGWGLALVGLWHWRMLSRTDRWILVLLSLPSVMCLLWTFVSSRLYYVLAPLLAVLALHGLRTLSERRSVQVSLVVVIIIGSYVWLFASDVVRVLLQ